jgi:hypothetical protein
MNLLKGFNFQPTRYNRFKRIIIVIARSLDSKPSGKYSAHKLCIIHIIAILTNKFDRTSFL